MPQRVADVTKTITTSNENAALCLIYGSVSSNTLTTFSPMIL
jgi:hypothetical protein